MILSIDAEKVFDKILDKNPQQSRDRWKIPQYHKGHIWKTHAKIIINGEN